MGATTASAYDRTESVAFAPGGTAVVLGGTVLRNGGCVGEGCSRACKVSGSEGGCTGRASGCCLRGSGAASANSNPVQVLFPDTGSSAVTLAFSLQIRPRTACPTQPAGRDFEVFVQRNITTRVFNCRFRAKEKMLGICGREHPFRIAAGGPESRALGFGCACVREQQTEQEDYGMKRTFLHLGTARCACDWWQPPLQPR